MVRLGRGLGAGGILLWSALVGFSQTRGYGEAPALHALVESGKLPPVHERLPKNPMLITPTERIGHYGGTWKIGLLAYGHRALLTRCLGYENLVRWDPLWSKVIPNLAQSWEININATVFNFHLRDGLRWSDGVPFTAHDLRAWYEDTLLDPAVRPSPPAWFLSGGRIGEIIAVDDTTVQFRFAEPNALFLQQLASAGSGELTRYPRHYMRQFHPKHQPASATNWVELVNARFAPWGWTNPDLPTMDAWHLTEGYLPGVTTVRATRNPYYWKIDPRGNQLPYLDEVVGRVVQDRAQLLQLATDGGINFQRDQLDGLTDFPALEAGSHRGDYRLIKTVPAMANPLAFCLNLVHRDPVLRTLFSRKDFRVALSEGLNRERIIREVYGTNARPWQVAPRPESGLSQMQFGTQYTQHDPAHANQLLDSLGLRSRDAQGFRLLSDGRRLTIRLLLHSNHAPEWPTALALMREDWRALGLELLQETIETSELYRRLNENLHDATIWWGDGGIAPIIQPEFYVPLSFEPMGPGRVPYAVPWATWCVNPRHPLAEEPPPAVLRQIVTYRQLLSEPDPAKQVALMRRVLDQAAEQFYVFGICLEQNRHAVLGRGFRNVPEPLLDAWTYPDPAPVNPCQFYLDVSVSKTAP